MTSKDAFEIIEDILIEYVSCLLVTDVKTQKEAMDTIQHDLEVLSYLKAKWLLGELRIINVTPEERKTVEELSRC